MTQRNEKVVATLKVNASRQQNLLKILWTCRNSFPRQADRPDVPSVNEVAQV